MNMCKECKYHTALNIDGCDHDMCKRKKINGYYSLINFQTKHDNCAFYCSFDCIPQTNETKDITLNDCIEYFQKVLTDGGVSGTDYELDDEETEIFKMAISALKILKEKQ